MARVLVVDDDADIAELLRIELEDAGHTVYVQRDPILALRAAERWHPDVVLLDVMMPVMNGFEVLRELREHHPTLPVWLMSAHMYSQLDASLLLGAQGFLTKPYNRDDVLSAVEQSA